MYAKIQEGLNLEFSTGTEGSPGAEAASPGLFLSGSHSSSRREVRAGPSSVIQGGCEVLQL